MGSYGPTTSTTYLLKYHAKGYISPKGYPRSKSIAGENSELMKYIRDSKRTVLFGLRCTICVSQIAATPFQDATQ